MIEVEQLSKSYGPYRGISDVSFSAKVGDILGFLGPNGAGKTTTIKMLTTCLAPSGGTAKIAGYDIRQEAARVREHIGYLPENPPLYDELTVYEYLSFLGELRGFSKKKLKGRIDELFEACLIKDVSKRLCGHLSKGYRQRVGLAQAILHKPKVILLDEPGSGLDPQQMLAIRKLIKDLAKESTILLSTHLLQEVSALCSKVVILNQGKLILEKELSELSETDSLENYYLSSVGGADSLSAGV